MGFLTLISFVGFTLFVAVVAWWATRKTDEKSADGYYLGGRSLGAVTIAGSLLLTNLSAEQIVGLNGQAFYRRPYGYGLGNPSRHCHCFYGNFPIAQIHEKRNYHYPRIY